ncbi:MAG: ATP-binding protein [Bacteroidetes bacterium]|nr:ATP-binding protein [Bacteroidota bacterium]
MLITRHIEDRLLKRIEDSQGAKKVIILYGARQVGKTTLIKQLLDKTKKRSEFFNCDYLDVQSLFSWENAGNLAGVVKNLDILVLDEAQRVKNIGLVLKILYDEYPHLQVIASGSSSFYLSNQVNEPLTGRKIIYQLFPFSYNEIFPSGSVIDTRRNLNSILRWGLYPSVITMDDQTAPENLKEISSSYLFKDILEFQHLKKPEILLNLLKLLAFQIGNEVSYTELSVKLRVDQTVVQRYIQLLEDNFVIFRLPAFKRNLRSEIMKSRKIYFWDVGIRNEVIQQLNPLEFRNDLGALWENFCMAERMKQIHYQDINSANSYFWRTYTQKEIDLIEETNGTFREFAFKWSASKKASLAADFKKNYEVTEFETITPENFREKLL